MSTKRIWLVNLFFGAGIAPTGAFLESVAERLKREGWQVEILAGNVAYNRGQGAGFGGRLVSWMLFYLRTALFAFTHRLPDKVLIMTTPPFMHLIFATRNWFARRKAELILWNQDTYPEVLAAVGMIRPKSLIYKMLLALERWGIQRADKVIALDRAMQQILENHGGKQVHVIPNWEIELGKGEELTNRALTECIEAAKANFRYLVLYTGNYGWGPGPSTLFDCLRWHPDERPSYSLFAGGGQS